jgi:hypothetical protein
MSPRLQEAPTARPASSYRSSRNRHLRDVDNVEAERLAVQADRVEAARAAMAQVVDLIIEATYSEPTHNRTRARKLLKRAWIDIAEVYRALSEPRRPFKTGLPGYRMVVRHRPIDPEVADLVPTSLPTAAMVEA